MSDPVTGQRTKRHVLMIGSQSESSSSMTYNAVSIDERIGVSVKLQIKQ